MYDVGEDGSNRAVMILFEDDSAGFSVTDAAGNASVVASVDEGGNPVVTIYYAQGNTLLGAP